MNVLDAKEETHRLIAEEKLEQVNFRTNIEKLTLLEEISWRQKFRVLHLKEGDANTRFFIEWVILTEKIMVLKA